MSSKFTLNEELKQMPFAVPENYFETFEVKKKFALTNDFKQNAFTIPSNYIDSFEVRKSFIINPEYKKIPFAVPVNYFETFEVRKSFALNPAYRQVPFVVPANYFETFEVRKFVLSEEYKSIPYTVPADYFDNLQVRIAERISTGETVSAPAVISWRSLRTQIAFAASFVLLIAIGLGLYTPATTENSPAVALQNGSTEIIPSDLYSIDEPTLFREVAAASVNNNNKSIGSAAEEAIIQYLAKTDIRLNDIAALY